MRRRWMRKIACHSNLHSHRRAEFDRIAMASTTMSMQELIEPASSTHTTTTTTTTTTNTTAKGTAHVSKKRFGEIKNLIEGSIADAQLASELIIGIQRILNYDPSASTCTPAQRRYVQQWRQRKVEETGKTLYEIVGGKAKYAARKEQNKSHERV